MNDPSRTAAVLLANVLNPTLALAALAGAYRLPKRASWRYALGGAGGIAVAVCLAEAGKKWQVWPGHPWFPSGHETFAAGCVACLVVRNPRVGAAVGGVGLPLMGWSLVRAGYHEPVDVVAGAALGLLVGGGIVRAVLPEVRKGRRPPAAESPSAPFVERR